MKITMFLMALGMVLSAGIANAAEGATCSARDASALTNNAQTDQKIAADATGTKQGQSNSNGEANGLRD